MPLQPVVRNAELASAIDMKDPEVPTFGLVLSDTGEKGNKDIPITSVDMGQPLVTRKELWSYYCGCLKHY